MGSTQPGGTLKGTVSVSQSGLVCGVSLVTRDRRRRLTSRHRQSLAALRSLAPAGLASLDTMLRPVVSLSVIARVHSHVVRRSRSFATTAAAAASTLQLHHQHGVPYHHCQPATRYTSLVRVGDTHSTSPLVLRRSISEVIEAVPGVGSLLWAASYFSDVRAVAALAAIGTLGYRWHMDRKRERLVSRETFVSEVMEHIERQYTPPPLLLDLPLLRRPKVSQLRGLIERRYRTTLDDIRSLELSDVPLHRGCVSALPWMCLW